MTETLPLAGLKVMVTRPREQATQLATGIENLGGRCMVFPLLEITALSDNQALRQIAVRLHEYQLAVFISPNAVKYGMQAIQEAGGLPASLQIATIGAGSAKILNDDYGVKKVIAPQQRGDSEALLELPELQAVSGKRVAIFRGDSGRELLGDTLKQRGAIVEYVACYQRAKPQHDVTALLAAQPDVLTISSSEALRNLWQMLDTAGRKQFSALPLFVSHERIGAAAHKLGWRHVVSVDGGDENLLAALTSWALHK